MDYLRLAERIRAARKAKGWNQERLEAESGVARRAIQRLEGAHADANPTVKTLESLAEALKVSPSEFGLSFSPANSGGSYSSAAEILSRIGGLPRDWREVVECLAFDDESKIQDPALSRAVRGLLKVLKVR
jgi:transcriptional regulator with XRE-family HTH domain